MSYAVNEALNALDKFFYQNKKEAKELRCSPEFYKEFTEELNTNYDRFCGVLVIKVNNQDCPFIAI